MNHRKAGKKLGRSPAHRKALYRNLALALFRHERIVTTVAKAKAVRPFVEKLITLAKRGDLHSRRLAIARLGTPGKAQVNPSTDKKEADTRTVIKKLFEDIGPRFADRPGGYTRIIKRHERRLGDGGLTAFLELLKEGEQKIRAKQPTAAAPAPAIEEEEEEDIEDDEDEDEERETSAEAEEGEEDEKEAAAAERTDDQPESDEKEKSK